MQNDECGFIALGRAPFIHHSALIIVTRGERAMAEHTGGYRDKMRGECVVMFRTILKRRNIPLIDLGAEMGVSTRTARRWVGCFGVIMPVEIVRGTVIVGRMCRKD